MDRTFLWQSIAVVAIALAFCAKDARLKAEGLYRSALFIFCLALFVMGTSLVINYVFSQIYA